MLIPASASLVEAIRDDLHLRNPLRAISVAVGSGGAVAGLLSLLLGGG